MCQCTHLTQVHHVELKTTKMMSITVCKTSLWYQTFLSLPPEIHFSFFAFLAGETPKTWKLGIGLWRREASFTFQGFNVKSRGFGVSPGFFRPKNFKSGPRLIRLKAFSILKCLKYRSKLGNPPKIAKIANATHVFHPQFVESVSCEAKEQPGWVLCWTLYLRFSRQKAPPNSRCTNPGSLWKTHMNFLSVIQNFPKCPSRNFQKKEVMQGCKSWKWGLPWRNPSEIWAFPTVFCWKLQARTSLLPYLDFSKSGNAWFFGNKLLVPTNLME